MRWSWVLLLLWYMVSRGLVGCNIASYWDLIFNLRGGTGIHFFCWLFLCFSGHKKSIPKSPYWRYKSKIAHNIHQVTFSGTIKSHIWITPDRLIVKFSKTHIQLILKLKAWMFLEQQKHRILKPTLPYGKGFEKNHLFNHHLFYFGWFFKSCVTLQSSVPETNMT